jgi:hypothetical protein
VTERGLFAVEVRPATAPDGRILILLQLPYGHMLLTPEDARRVAAMLSGVADELDSKPHGC